MENVKKHSDGGSLAFLGLQFLRALLVLSPGYIHPDEFFQSGQEVFATKLWGEEVTHPWEFVGDRPIRSLAVLVVSSLLPALVGREIPQFSSEIALFGPRLICLLLSYKTDYTIKQICQKYGLSGQTMLYYAASWPVLLFSSRPFSNTIEAFLFMQLLGVYLLQQESLRKYATIGVVCVLGIWCRFTFAFFALPVVLRILISQLFTSGAFGPAVIRAAKASTTPNDSSEALFSRLFRLFVIAAAALLCALGLTVLDTVGYYWLTGRPVSSPVIAPLNALIYNSQTQNLQQHGLHPRVTHYLVNFPMLFSPLALWVYTKAALKRFRGVTAVDPPSDASKVVQLCVDICTSGLLFLSLAPHQEPRFLLPLAFSICVVVANGVNASTGPSPRRLMWWLWTVVFVVFFGFLHQAGVVPGMLFLGSLLKSTSTVCSSRYTMVYYRTYMPPAFLLRSSFHSAQFKVVDLSGDTSLNLAHYLPPVANESMASFESRDEMLLTIPASVPLTQLAGQVCVSGVDTENAECGATLIKLGSWLHISTEDLPMFPEQTSGTAPQAEESLVRLKHLLQQMMLDIYKVERTTHDIADGTVNN